MTTKAEWKAARAVLDAIEKERADLLEPTALRYHEAKCRLEDIQDEIGEPLICECGTPIFGGEPSHFAGDVVMCVECAPTYGDMLDRPEQFTSFESGKPMSADLAKAFIDIHLAAGGSLADKMVSP